MIKLRFYDRKWKRFGVVYLTDSSSSQDALKCFMEAASANLNVLSVRQCNDRETALML